MIPKRQIVVISSIDWDAPWQRHQIFASQFAEAGHEVFFVENSGFRNPGFKDFSRVAEKAADLFKKRHAAPGRSGKVKLFSPKVLPPTQRILRSLNRRLLVPELVAAMRQKGLRPHPLVIAYFPTTTCLELIKLLDPAAVVYDCASNFRAHPQAPKDLKKIEGELLRRSALVVCDSDYLFAQKKAEHRKVIQIHQGVSKDFFDVSPPAPDFRRACYYGTWAPELDADLLRALDAAGLEVTVSGYSKGPAPDFPPSIRRLAPTALCKLKGRLENYDVFLMPYKITPFHLGVVPAKIYECLAMGRPVLATPLPSLKPYAELIYIAENPEDWARIARGLPNLENEYKRRRRIALAREHTHEKEFARFSRAVAEVAPSG